MSTEHLSETAELVGEVIEASHSTFLSLDDAKTWVLFSFLIFVTIMWFFTRKLVCNLLDARSEKIKTELEEAETLRKEANKLLEEYKDKHAKASQEAEKIIDDAKKYAITLKEQAAHDARHQSENREKNLRNRIKKAELAAIAELNEQVVSIATKAAKIMLEENISNDDALVTKAISELPKKF